MSPVIDGLRELFGDRVGTAASVREQHCGSLTWLPAQPPDAVVFARSRDDVVAAVRLCAEHGTPLIPYGAGTSLEGQVNAPYGGVCLDLSGMNEIVAIDADDLTATVQPGVTREALNRRLREHGVFFSVDPGADASLGGMASTRASGTTTVRYGTMRENVRNLEVVLADGRVIRAGARAAKSAAGYDLARLFVGAEGTLGVITELTVRLHPVPERVASGVCAFDDLAGAVHTVTAAIRLGLEPARIELLNPVTVRACNAYSGLGLPETVHLFVELHGGEDEVSGRARAFGDLVKEHGGTGYAWSTDAGERARLWRARHDAWWAIHALHPGRRGIPTDVCVPISRLAECVTATERDIADSGVDAPIVGHVGDGNFHLLIMVDPDDADMTARAAALTERLHLRAIGMGGTCTGEHGIGQGKAAMMPVEHGDALGVMRAIKQALDPAGIMNPGKVLT
ncbi:FAD-linked oxidase C-terminal domain-containing protein [Nonomuraea sp. NPDC049419]|uniref:FAD-binding oxidoreductase n=1 Tax=Nonomuraea sp. NPDC049419 TaxID=3155772 RepID=UPI00341BD88D